MLIAGFALRNIVEASGSKALILDTEWSSALKSIALVVILTRAGLGLKLDALKKLSAALLRLIFIPNLSEAVVDAAFAVAFFDMPWTFALALGFIISAVSPAVVVPSLLSLQ
jgi:NhaP-type Na+/H+ or K+/H+ antiporter